ncbi:MAG: hypothetical protein ABSH51_30245 [Solirubrobacteraceae bacterium]|jgi:hypothetical protein
MIEADGAEIDGQDAAATLLTQLSRSPLVVRGLEPGTYQLDRNALVRLFDQREALHAEADAHIASTTNTDYDAIDVAQALAAIEARIRRIERVMREAHEIVHRLSALWFFADPDQPEAGVEPPAAVAA